MRIYVLVDPCANGNDECFHYEDLRKASDAVAVKRKDDLESSILAYKKRLRLGELHGRCWNRCLITFFGVILGR